MLPYRLLLRRCFSLYAAAIYRYYVSYMPPATITRLMLISMPDSFIFRWLPAVKIYVMLPTPCRYFAALHKMSLRYSAATMLMPPARWRTGRREHWRRTPGSNASAACYRYQQRREQQRDIDTRRTGYADDATRYDAATPRQHGVGRRDEDSVVTEEERVISC